MDNDIQTIMPKVLATGLNVLRSRVVMTRVVNTDYSTDAAKKGATIDVPVSQKRNVSDVVPGPTSTNPEDTDIKTVPVSLDNWKKANFGLTDNELNKIAAKEYFIPAQMQEAFDALATAINQSIYDGYKGIYGVAGTAGTTPFSTDASEAIEARKVLNQQRCWRDNRWAAIDFDAGANALALPTFADADKVGSSDVKISGEIGMKYGFYWMEDDDVPTHTAGDASGYQTNGSHATGDDTIAIDTGSGDFNVGDIITFAGHDQTYTVKTATSTQLTIAPALVQDVTDNTAISSKASHVVNIAGHRDAFALAMRAPDLGLKEVYNDANSFTMADPETGLVMRLELVRQYKQVFWEVDCLWGTALVDPRLACRIMG